MRSPEAKRLPGIRWVGVTVAFAWAVLGVLALADSVLARHQYYLYRSTYLYFALAALANGAVVLALVRSKSRFLWPSARGHRLSALLLLVWSLAVLAACMDASLVGTYPPGYSEDDALSVARYLVHKWSEGYLQASVPLLAGIVAAWWQLTDAEATSRFRSGLAAGMAAGVVSTAALVLVLGGLLALLALTSIGLASISLPDDPLVVQTVTIFAVAVVPVGALCGLLGGLVGGVAAMVTRRASGSRGTRSPA